MKKFRSIWAMALAVVMSFSIMVPVFAAEVEPDEVIQSAVTATVDVPEDDTGGGDDGIMPLESKKWSMRNDNDPLLSKKLKITY